MEEQANQYQDYLQRHEQGFAAFTEIYRSRNPQPEPAEEQSADLVTILALAVLVIASVIVSGSRTIVEFGGGGVGVAAFIMLELAMIAYAYWRAKRAQPSPALPEPGDEAAPRSWWRKVDASSWGMWIAFGVSMVANIHAVLKAALPAGQQFPEAFGVAIGVALAISAPTLALIAGDMLGREAVALVAARLEQKRQHGLALQEWNAELNRAWDRAKASWIGKLQAPAAAQPQPTPPAPQLSQSFHEDFMKTSGESKPRVKLHEVARAVHKAGDQELSTEALMEKYRISMGGTSKVRQMVKAMNGNSVHAGEGGS